jgi:hypothetical protein
MDLAVILKALHNVSLNEGACTERVAEVVLGLLSALLDLGLLARCGPPPLAAHRAPAGLRPEGDALTDHNLVLDIVVRLLRLLGCPHGCGERAGWGSGEFLRGQAISLLTRCRPSRPPHAATSRLWFDQKQFKWFIAHLVEQQPLPSLLSFLHSYLGFCTELTNPLSPGLATGRQGRAPGPRSQELVTAVPSPPPAQASPGYSNNFGEPGGAGVEGTRAGVQVRIVGTALHLLVSRLAGESAWLGRPEQASLHRWASARTLRPPPPS